MATSIIVVAVIAAIAKKRDESKINSFLPFFMGVLSILLSIRNRFLKCELQFNYTFYWSLCKALQYETYDFFVKPS
ncbi:MAG: DUF4231 domain-containing protein [Candidatus Gastranaerophilaceae bacterium]